VTRGQVPGELRRSLELWAGCVAGALTEEEYRDNLAAAGFEEISIELVREYTAADAESGGLAELMRRYAKQGADGLGIFSAIVRARRGSGQLTVDSGQMTDPRPAPEDERLPVVSPGRRSASGCGPGCC
jgi:hypothetical protein